MDRGVAVEENGAEDRAVHCAFRRVGPPQTDAHENLRAALAHPSLVAKFKGLAADHDLGDFPAFVPLRFGVTGIERQGGHLYAEETAILGQVIGRFY